MKKRLISFVLALTMILSMIPMQVSAAHDSMGKPLDLTGDVYLALYIGDDFPGEPAEHAVSGYLNLNKDFESPGFTMYADSAQGILKEQILDDVVQGTSGVWGVFSTTGGSKYIDPACGIVNEDGSHNAEVERKIIQTAIDNNKFALGEGESIDDYTIIWYIIKYQKSDSAWHIDGLITKKSTYSVNYYGNGNTSGAAPTGVDGLESGDTYTVLGNPGSLRKTVGRDYYIFNGWNTKSDGTGEHYAPGDKIVITDHNVTLYAEWYLQNKYTVTVVTKLDDDEKNVEDIFGESVEVYIKSDFADAELIPLEKTTTGTYTTTVTDNATYEVIFIDENGNSLDTHGHNVVIYNQNGRTELLHYSVSYDTNGGSWKNGQTVGSTNHHAYTSVDATSNIPVRDGYKFTGWKDQDGNTIQPGDRITSNISEKTVLTAQWEKLVNIKVNVYIDHKSLGDSSLGNDLTNTIADVSFQLVKVENGVNTPIGQIINLSKDDYSSDDYSYTFTYDSTTHTSSYIAKGYTFENMESGTYSVSAPKRQYDVVIDSTTDEDGNVTINIRYQYTPQNFDFEFDVVVNDWENIEEELRPIAANIKVTFWGYNEEGILGWHTITQQMGSEPPVTVYIGEDGTGSGFYPVWKYLVEDNGTISPYFYRVEVSSFVMPDGSTMKATTEDEIVYTAGIYSGTVVILPEGIANAPDYPAGSDTDLEGTIYVEGEDKQDSVPTVFVDVTPFKVTFVAGEGTVNGKDVLVLENQYKYPNLNNYTAVPTDENDYFSGWFDAEGNKVQNMNGLYLTGDVTYYAQYMLPMSVQGTVSVDSYYIQDGQTVYMNDNARANEVMILLQKNINGVYNSVDSIKVPVTYVEGEEHGTAEYLFENIPHDETEYRIHVIVYNYAITYDNESDEGVSYTKDEYTAITGNDNVAVVDVHLSHSPDSYTQLLEVDASQIAPGFRPNAVLSEVIYRDLGDIHHYEVISQHKVSPFGAEVVLNQEGKGSGEYDVWKYNMNGSLFEYQMNITKVYGDVDNVLDPEGTKYDSDSAPFKIEYSESARYSAMNDDQSHTLKATLIPKEYEIIFNLGEGVGIGQVDGMSEYLTDAPDGSIYYSYLHTWSYKDNISAFPYREGYVFDGWESNHEGVVVTEHGYITIAAAVAEDVVLTAKWKELKGTAYTVRHLELNTDKVLMGAVSLDGITVGTKVAAVDVVADIEGYSYAGAKIGDTLYGLNAEPVMTVVQGTDNLITIYYTKDGYTDQVESNLKLDKTAILENNGTYTINLETYTMDNPVTTLIQQNIPLDIVLVIDQSGSIVNGGYLDDLQAAVDNFVEVIADHGRHNEVDHRIAIVGYASNATCGPTGTNTNQYPIAGGNTSQWVNTGVFDSNGDFHPYTVTGFNYTKFTGEVKSTGVYYTFHAESNEYLLLTYHEVYRHLITEEEARLAVAEGVKVYGYVYDENDVGGFVELTRNSSGLWLYGDRKLYSKPEFFTYHEDVWTHRHGLDRREIHAYGTGNSFTVADEHGDLYTRTETTNANPHLNVYKDALIPVSVGANGSGGTNANLIKATQSLGSNGGTYVSYGIEMANKVFEQNPIEEGSDRVRIMVMFTDGLPGQSGFDTNEANNAIEEAYKTKNTYGALSYTIGLYKSSEVANNSNEEYYMNAVSSNYPKATSLDSVKQPASYSRVRSGKLGNGNTYYARHSNGNYYLITYGSATVNGSTRNRWYYTVDGVAYNVSTSSSPNINSLSTQIYTASSTTLAPTEYSDFYSTTDSELYLKEYFEDVVTKITTNITKEIILHEDTILRDIMGQGLVLTEGSVITAYKQAGKYNHSTGEIDWSETKDFVAQVVIPENNTNNVLTSPETTSITYVKEDGSETTKDNVPYITVYNLTAENATNPNFADNYNPHTIDITGYDFENWYINDSDHTEGYKMVVEITRIEATDDVEWGRSVTTNHERSGLWLPTDENGNRTLLLAFDQPSTIFVERAYVIDYGKEFNLNGWYFDSEGANIAVPQHIDADVESGMNYFETPAVSSGKDADYGNVSIRDGKVYYAPTTTNWGGYDEFYVFGNTWRKTVLAQDANQNGNLWNKVIVIPANNIYYEDSFITTEDTTGVNSITGFKFTGSWEVVYSDEETAGSNTEVPEKNESAPYGDVHGWTDSLGDDTAFTDGSAHGTGLNKEIGASVEFTFTGTGVEVYTRTNAKSGVVLAILTRIDTNEDGTTSTQMVKSILMDNLAVSGDYYHIPSVSFAKLPYGTYSVRIVATSAVAENDGRRYEYYVDGIRVLNPLGNTTNYMSDVVKDAYGYETNSVFTSIRDILLDYGDFNGDMNVPDSTDGKLGAVFIDQIKEGQTCGSDNVGVGENTYEIGTFEKYGPKHEVYLAPGQAIVIKVDESNRYYVGLKSLNGGDVVVNVSGIELASPTQITIDHTTDMYYRVTPIDGYIVIQNGSTTEGSLLSVTNLRITNEHNPVSGLGVLPLTQQAALMFMNSYTEYLANPEETPIPEAEKTQPEQNAENIDALTMVLFGNVRSWMQDN